MPTDAMVAGKKPMKPGPPSCRTTVVGGREVWRIKSLDKHWLFDKTALQHIVNSAEIKASEVVLEIYSGLGTLTHELTRCRCKGSCR